MRMIMQVSCPNEQFNSEVRKGTAGQTIKRILDDIKAEAVYFSERDGERGAILIVNVNNPAEVPRLAEPFFLNFNASVEFRVCMTPEDLAKSNLEELGKKWG